MSLQELYGHQLGELPWSGGQINILGMLYTHQHKGEGADK